MKRCPVCGDFDIGDWCNSCNIPTRETNTSEPSYEPDIYDMAYREEIDSQGYWIELPDGYNGDKEKFFIVPIEDRKIDNVVKLRCATEGKKHLTRWVTRMQFDKIMSDEGWIMK